jgi:hypothetical protein
LNPFAARRDQRKNARQPPHGATTQSLSLQPQPHRLNHSCIASTTAALPTTAASPQP